MENNFGTNILKLEADNNSEIEAAFFGGSGGAGGCGGSGGCGGGGGCNGGSGGSGGSGGIHIEVNEQL